MTYAGEQDLEFSHGNPLFNILRNCQTVFQSDWIIYIPTSNVGVPISPPPSQHLLMSFFFLAILVGVKW